MLTESHIIDLLYFYFEIVLVPVKSVKNYLNSNG